MNDQARNKTPWSCRLGFHRHVTVAYGYPPYRRTWLTIRHCAHCGKFVFEWDSVFADSRPEQLPLALDALMYTGDASLKLRQRVKRLLAQPVTR